MMKETIALILFLILGFGYIIGVPFHDNKMSTKACEELGYVNGYEYSNRQTYCIDEDHNKQYVHINKTGTFYTKTATAKKISVGDVRTT